MEYGQQLVGQGSTRIDPYSKALEEIEIDQLEETQPAKALSICDLALIDTNTLEYQALTTIAHVDNAAQFYSPLNLEPVDPVTINLFPSQR